MTAEMWAKCDQNPQLMYHLEKMQEALEQMWEAAETLEQYEEGLADFRSLVSEWTE